MTLLSFKKNPTNNTYRIKFDDSTEFMLTPKLLREECPCAHCKGEEVLLKKYIPLNKLPNTGTAFQIEKIETVGNYALRIFWKDGHDTGIYSWEYLKKVCESGVGGQE